MNAATDESDGLQAHRSAGIPRRPQVSAVLGVGLFLGVLLAILAVAAAQALPAVVSGAWSVALSVVAVPAIFVGYVLYAVVRRGLEVRDLAREGLGVEGRVVDKRSFAGRAGRVLKYQVIYEYRDASGRVNRRGTFVSGELWRQLVPGDQVEVVHLPRRPTVSALRTEIEQVLVARGGGGDGGEGSSGEGGGR